MYQRVYEEGLSKTAAAVAGVADCNFGILRGGVRR